MDTSQVLSIKESAFSWAEKARAFNIRSDADLLSANDLLRGIKGLRKQIDEAFDPIIKSAHEAHKKAVEQKKEYEAPVAEAERIIKGAMGVYAVEQEKARKKEQEEAERRLLDSAAKAENEGKQDLADAIIEHGPQAMPEAEKPKLEGTSIRMVVKWKVTNEQLVPRAYLMIDAIKIGAEVRKGGLETKIPGIKVYEEPSVTSRA